MSVPVDDDDNDDDDDDDDDADDEYYTVQVLIRYWCTDGHHFPPAFTFLVDSTRPTWVTKYANGEVFPVVGEVIVCILGGGVVSGVRTALRLFGVCCDMVRSSGGLS